MPRADLSGANLKGAVLDYADLAGANLSGAVIPDTRLNGLDFSNADLSGSDLTGGQPDPGGMKNVDLRGADLNGIKYDKFTLRFIAGSRTEGARMGTDLERDLERYAQRRDVMDADK